MNFLSILAGFALLYWGAWVSVEDATMLWNLKAFAMVVGGAFVGAVISYRLPFVTTFLPAMMARLFVRRHTSGRKTVEELSKFNEAFRSRSMVLGEMVNKSRDPFMRESMTLLLEGIIPPDKIQNVLLTRAQWLYDRELREARQLRSLARYAFVAGLVATIVGTMHVFLNPPFFEAWGPSFRLTPVFTWMPALSTAFMGLVYGVGLGHLVFHPLSENLRTVAEEAFQKNQVIAHGVALMSQHINPLHFTEELNSYLSPLERVEWKAA
ncbi:MAG TPA: MotA/TolQ/ExbB proton channel family protein [Bdellovibrionales bacterium]|nr:MotA/TolQ/ExbB proton channel family protein [Bdellovibrionales bacterium]